MLLEKIGNRNSEAGILINLGNVFTQTNELPKALAYKKEALEINKKVGNKSMIANNLINIGNVYTSMEDYPQALQTHQESLRISESIGDRKNIAYNLVGISSVYVKQGKYTEAREYGLKATQVAGEIALLSPEKPAAFLPGQFGTLVITRFFCLPQLPQSAKIEQDHPGGKEKIG